MTADELPSRWSAASHPFIYEIATWPWLASLSARVGYPVDLGSVPSEQWDALADLGVDAVWFMGVWQRSPAGLALALANTELRASFDSALPGWRDEDVVGSPYCIRGYEVDAHLGGRAGLARARAELASRGLGLVLDFVPNHVAPDHLWTRDHPDRFVRGTDADLREDPHSFVAVGDEVLANGKDPFFAAWPDVVQLDAFSPALRAAVLDTLRDIADQCDGVRCDMAMLVMNDVFERTWGSRVSDRPPDDYWPFVIGAMRDSHPGFTFIAEAYWDLEWQLQQHGFDFCYDKRLYDRLRDGAAEPVRLHLTADLPYQQRLVRFLENHDEPRAASVFSPAAARTAAVATLTQTGARLVHDGQLEGRHVRLPVFLGRAPDERIDLDLLDFYRRLMRVLADRTFHEGRWELCDRTGWPGNDGYEDLVAWCWDGATRWLVVVNLGERPAAGHVRLPWQDLRGARWHLVDPTQDAAFDRGGDELCDGLYVELEPDTWHLLRIDPADVAR